jgi:DNA repair protein RecO (recombination protein O)
MNKGLYSTEALVLRCRKYREADGLLVLLTRDRGKINAVAKGIFKPASSLRGGVQTLTLNAMQLYAGKTLHTVTQSECLDAFLTLKDHLEAMLAASCWAEMLEALLPEEAPDEAVYALALKGLYALAMKPEPLIRRGLEIQLIDVLGFGPVLDRCADCQRLCLGKGPVFFSLESGGLVCERCKKAGALPISPEAAALWRTLGSINFSKMGRIKGRPLAVNQLGDAVEAWIGLQAGRPMRSWHVIKMMGGFNHE